MNTNFFDIANTKFFNPLTGKNKKVNYDLLCLINKSLEKETTLDKSVLSNIINDYIHDHPFSEVYDDENQNHRADLRSFPNDKLRYFEECGWISSEPTNNFRQVYQMEPVAIELLRFMNDIEIREDRPIESAGFVYNIYSSLRNFDYKEATYITERMMEDSKSLNVNLRTVSSRIKRYLNTLMKRDHQSPKKILKELLLNYQSNVVAKSFDNLRRKDNPSKYKDYIIENIRDLKNNHMDELISDYIDKKYNGVMNEENQLIARVFFNDTFNQIIDQFENIDKVISVLEMQNSKYVTSARKRVTFLLNEKTNIEGQIDNILRLIENNKIDEELEFSFNLDSRGKIDDTSLYVYTKNKNPEPSIASLTSTPYDEEAEAKYIQKVRWQAKFSIANVNSFVMKELGDADEIKASDIAINGFDDFIILFMAQIFSESDIVDYHIEPCIDEEIKYDNRAISNFMIKRRIE